MTPDLTAATDTDLRRIALDRRKYLAYLCRIRSDRAAVVVEQQMDDALDEIARRLQNA